MLKRCALLAALAAVLVTFAGSAGAITGNYQKDFEHDFVGLLVVYDASGEFAGRCSGSLISPTVFVTAGHCTTGSDEARIYFQQDAGVNYDPATGVDPITGYPETGGYTGTPYNFGFDGFASFPNTRDAGVVILDGAGYTPPSGKFGVLPQLGAVDAYAAQKKQDARFTVSGYGLSDKDPVIVSFRERLRAESYLVNNQAPITEFNLKTTANPSQDKGGTCNGDSGGPVFFRGTNVIAAVTSFGFNGQCKGLDFSYRLDRAPVLAWINDPNRVDAG
ncbi:MAG: S1 family peptidase [Actinomycetota bacterium]|nr:S1 family peptidase [Actinomycetota bacterium]